ncbi:MAG: O-antigen ligase family protein [Cytophagales bacterium]|nr:O-antigen ligase family protein [Cytophagales bacterium]MCA6369605.1 O-antigen ligase family protein [Cytophagales bacterium]MCA6370681.1 O-antigen ligase family protein [Cytophagales bacterium]MCA6374585.1 O-antigen ligase family protein [Cytophagales bacterium]MCA6383790.1 O-antigen ligase family protein [Cytophagales bacterium]
MILAIGLTYSTDLTLGLRQLETNLSLLGVPLVVYGLGGFSRERMNNTFYAFAAGALVAGLICIINAAVSFTKTGDYQVFFYNQFTQPVDSHPTYFAYYLIFIITFGLYLLYYELPKQFVGPAVVALLFFFVLLLLTGGQTAFISLLLTFAFFISKYTLEEKTRRESLVVALVGTMLLCMVVVTIVFRNNEQFFSVGSQNDYWERMALWKSAIAANTNPLLGVGTGDYNLVLNEYYREHDMNHFAEENFNSHNQFIQMYFSNGLVGLFGLLLVLGRPLYVSVTQRNLLGILLYFPFLMYGVTEVFLGRYQGVVFLALVHQILISQQPDPSVAIEPLKVNKL